MRRPLHALMIATSIIPPATAQSVYSSPPWRLSVQKPPECSAVYITGATFSAGGQSITLKVAPGPGGLTWNIGGNVVVESGFNAFIPFSGGGTIGSDGTLRLNTANGSTIPAGLAVGSIIVSLMYCSSN